jgi:hypothetical protein
MGKFQISVVLLDEVIVITTVKWKAQLLTLRSVFVVKSAASSLTVRSEPRAANWYKCSLSTFST